MIAIALQPSCPPSPTRIAHKSRWQQWTGESSRKLVEASLERADADAITAAVAIAPKLGKLTLVDWVQADETTVNRRAMEALEHCEAPGVGVGSDLPHPIA